MELMQAEQALFDPRPQMSRVFVEGFYPWIKAVCNDKEKLTEVFAHMFDLSKFFIAIKGEQVAAMASCTSSISPVVLDKKVFVQVLGQIRGRIAYVVLKRHMMNNSLPFAISPKTGVIEFVATAPEFRQQGAARALLTYIMNTQPYDAYMLEVADNNTNAVRLYEKLGFSEIKRVRAPKRSGVNFFVYMRKT